MRASIHPPATSNLEHPTLNSSHSPRKLFEKLSESHLRSGASALSLSLLHPTLPGHPFSAPAAAFIAAETSGKIKRHV
jgi:hypothetical protein